MFINYLSVPFRYVQLIIRYTHNLLTETEADEPDNRIVESDENGEVFETLTDDLDDRIFSAEELIAETEDLLETWVIAGLIARNIEGIISEEEEQSLQDWLEVSEEHQRRYELLKDKANLQKFVRWAKKKQGSGKWTR